MEQRHATFVRRLAQADRNCTNSGNDPQPFQLLPGMGALTDIEHPAWDRSWPGLTALDVDDLEELGYVRVLERTGLKRVFALTVKGRTAGAQLDQTANFPVSPGGGRAPSAPDTLRWLVQQADANPAILDLPTRILDLAITQGVIEHNGRNALARRIRELVNQGFLTADFADFDQGSDEQLLANTQNLALTVAAHREAGETAASSARAAPVTNIYNTIVNSQIAGGNITNTTTFVDVLVQVEQALDQLDGVAPEDREEAKGLLRRLLGKGAEIGGEVITDTAGALVSAALSKVLGLPPG
jgi:hypothetical protein